MIPRGSNLRNIKIIVSINGLPINNSPFYATVKTERLRESWKRILLYGEEGSDPGKFCRPWGIAIARLPLQHDSTHKPVGDNQKDIPIPSKPFYTCNNSNLNKTDYLLIVADRSNNRIQSFKLSTANASATKPNCYSGNNKVEISVLNIFGSGPGTRPGQFDRPAGIAINSNLGQLVVADKDNHRIQVYFLLTFSNVPLISSYFRCLIWLEIFSSSLVKKALDLVNFVIHGILQFVIKHHLFWCLIQEIVEYSYSPITDSIFGIAVNH